MLKEFLCYLLIELTNVYLQVFQELNQKFTAYELDIREDGGVILDILSELTGANTVPRVFINGNFI